jgi:aspartokinase
VEFASTNGVALVVRSSVENVCDTWVRPHNESEQIFRPSRSGIAGVSGRKDVIRITFNSAEFSRVCGDAIFDLIARYDLIFGATSHLNEPTDILISNLEIPEPAAFARRLQDQFGDAITVSDQLGMVSLVGFGLGSRPASFLDAFRVLQRAHISVAKSFTTRESLCFVIPISMVDKGVTLMHEVFIERRRSENILSAVSAKNSQIGITV